MAILVTGGAGYIGSHTCIELLENDYEIIIVDNFSNSNPDMIRRISEITKKKFLNYNVNILEKQELSTIFQENKIESVIHFAGYKAVGESVQHPLKYYSNNIIGTINLLEVMDSFNVRELVFSSSATVYGVPDKVPIEEDSPLDSMNPYGRTKLIIEEILGDIYNANSDWSIALLRYFNPIGAHESGMIGEEPNGIPNNLMPYITQVAAGKLDCLNVYGNDYDTHDGTGVRDYVHVVDLAKGHIKALEKISGNKGIEAYNLGTEIGYSVLDLIKNFEAVSGKRIPYIIGNRRVGDVAECYADSSKAYKVLGWKAQKDILEMCKDSWNWEKTNK